jgi:monosaccharide-transporting ATPase
MTENCKNSLFSLNTLPPARTYNEEENRTAQGLAAYEDQIACDFVKGGKLVSDDILLRMTNVTKTFPGVKALNGVNFALRRGEVHALMGENGAGKSTLIKVLTGVYEMDEGEAYLGGRKLNISTPQEAQNEGISTVYQEVNLCANLTVAENIYIGRLPKTRGAIDWKRINKGSEELLARLNLFIDVKQPLSAYSVAIQQMIAIARAVDMSSGVLILDEPTSSLDKQEVAQLFAVMNKLRSEGMGIIFVTHFLDQVYEITDRITVLRNGTFVGEYRTEELPKSSLVSNMIGREWSEHEGEVRKERDLSRTEVFLSATGISRKGSIEPVSLEVRKGEVVGIAGLLGSGRTELVKLIFGIDKPDQGVIAIGSETFSAMYPKSAIRKGMGFCPEDRKEAGIVGELTIRENIALALQAKRGLFSYIPLRKQQETAAKFIELLRIKTPSMEQRLDALSGGNQQKVILARWLATEPNLLILDEPTRGIDVGSKGEIRSLILRLAQSGISILIISSELQEMIDCSDRIIVLRDRVQIGEVSGARMNENHIMNLIAEGAGGHDLH